MASGYMTPDGKKGTKSTATCDYGKGGKKGSSIKKGGGKRY